MYKKYIIIFFFQDRIFFCCGQLMAISLVTRGNGFNLMSRAVYQYVCGTEISDIEFDLADVPEDARPICRAVSAKLPLSMDIWIHLYGNSNT